MKKKVELRSVNESCVRMNIPKNLTKGNLKEEIVVGNIKLEEENTDIPSYKSQSSPDAASSKSFSENERKSQINEDSSSSDEKVSPPLSSLGPGAEIKGKICHPIPSGTRHENAESSDSEGSKTVPAGVSGGRLTFFKEGKLLLELSHRSDQGSAWVQVKSKTYWPPSSTATTAIIQHPLRHDTPTTASDDCSSMNSSPWSNDHIRKQVGPNSSTKIVVPNAELFFLHTPQFIKNLRRKIRRTKNPYVYMKGPVGENINTSEPIKVQLKSQIKDIKFNDRRKRLEKKIEELGEKCSYKIDKTVSIYSCFEKVDINSDNVDPTFISPRKRYLRSLDGDADSHIRKRVHSSFSNNKHCDRPSSSSPSYITPHHKSAINSHTSSSYSIDSLLSSENETKKNESFLKTLLKPEKHRQKSDISRDRIDGTMNHVKYERGSSPYRYQKERKDSSSEHKKSLTDRLEMNAAEFSRYSSSPNLSSLYLNPYFDPRYMMLQSLSTPPPFIPSASQPADMAVAVAAAAAAGYPFSPLHMSALTGGSLLSHGGLQPPYSPTTSVSSQLIHSVSPNHSSPLHHLSSSPNPKPSMATPTIYPLQQPQHIGRANCPRENLWPASSHRSSSPQRLTSSSSSSLSLPPQDAPLNLSKPKSKS